MQSVCFLRLLGSAGMRRKQQTLILEDGVEAGGRPPVDDHVGTGAGIRATQGWDLISRLGSFVGVGWKMLEVGWEVRLWKIVRALSFSLSFAEREREKEKERWRGDPLNIPFLMSLLLAFYFYFLLSLSLSLANF